METNVPVKILLIDDDEDDREFFELAVKDSVYSIDCISTTGVTEAFSSLQSETRKPDYIFLDLNMPGIDGRTGLKEFKKREVTRDIPVVVFSTSSEQQDILDVKSLGATHFITKPPSIELLKAELDSFLKQQSKK